MRERSRGPPRAAVEARGIVVVFERCGRVHRGEEALGAVGVRADLPQRFQRREDVLYGTWPI